MSLLTGSVKNAYRSIIIIGYESLFSKDGIGIVRTPDYMYIMLVHTHNNNNWLFHIAWPPYMYMYIITSYWPIRSQKYGNKILIPLLKLVKRGITNYFYGSYVNGLLIHLYVIVCPGVSTLPTLQNRERVVWVEDSVPGTCEQEKLCAASSRLQTKRRTEL